MKTGKNRREQRARRSGPGTTNVLFAGVGGQGIILASDLLAEAALLYGLDVKKSEVHGMAQRGGSVVSQVRFGECVASPLISEGQADYLVVMEEMEGLRHLEMLKRNGVMIINRQRIVTMGMVLGHEQYPEESIESLPELPIDVLFIDGPALAGEAGHPRTINTVMLGALSTRFPFEEKIWLSTLKNRLPEKLFEVNWKAFIIGASSLSSAKENA